MCILELVAERGTSWAAVVVVMSQLGVWRVGGASALLWLS